MLLCSFITRAKRHIVSSRLFEAKCTIRTASDDSGIMIVLPVVFPEANWADLEAASFAESEETTAWALQSSSGFRTLDHRVLVELTAVLVEPPASSRQFFRRWCLIIGHVLVWLIILSGSE